MTGYREALAEAGIEADDALVAEAYFDAPSGHSTMATLLDRTQFTAVFVASDVVALGAIVAIRERGLHVPLDISVVGFDDIPLVAFFDPPLTTVRVPAFDLGHAAGLALLARLDGSAVPTETLLPTEFIVRGTTAPPPSPLPGVGL